MVALLASLLVLLPAASAASSAMTVEVVPSTGVAEIGQEIYFYYTLTNTGDQTLLNVCVDGIGVEDTGVIDELPPGEDRVVTETYVIVEGDLQTNWDGTQYVLDDAVATACNCRGRPAVTSYASAIVLVTS